MPVVRLLLLLLLLLGMASVHSAPTPGQEEINEKSWRKVPRSWLSPGCLLIHSHSLLVAVRAKMEDVTTTYYRPGDYNPVRQQKIFNRPNDPMSGVLATSKGGTVEGRIRASNPAYNPDPGKVLMENGKAIDDPLPNTDGFTISSKDVAEKGGGRQNGNKFGFDIHCNSKDHRDGSETACQRRVSNMNAELKSKSKTSNREFDPKIHFSMIRSTKAGSQGHTKESSREKAQTKRHELAQSRRREENHRLCQQDSYQAFPNSAKRKMTITRLCSPSGEGQARKRRHKTEVLWCPRQGQRQTGKQSQRSRPDGTKASKSTAPSSKKSSRNKKVHSGKKAAKKAVGKKSPKKPSRKKSGSERPVGKKSAKRSVGKKSAKKSASKNVSRAKRKKTAIPPPSPPPTRR
ncbi:hypothetical protein DFJ73DRAFT_955997 [Zopfochytrium polystomum]|nr:hypothetical protein DFJ73DRAFT_955997 [Zopfochytrium polystomum]